ncbi:FtsX-like permease family protein [Trebonia kvetii]|uniref:FtsX-like permease family protein n=1 Tax=Trebonia kvetii TaxID=2480626 RepID=A0A6P2C4R8_9ACTN|nr:FtsX-like permease family protein [Trebonia kvetii]TVZ05495.1 FtsX-like permease family protein [Trebonia kvetii]
MSMSTYAREDRQAREPEDPRRAAGARRALSRWALRLALREWRQRVLIVVLIAVATAATLLGIAVGSATPGTPNAGTFGTARTRVELPGSTPHLASVIARIEKAYGAGSVIEDLPITTGQAGGADLRAQDPSAPYTRPLLALDSGHYPASAGQVAVTAGLARLYSLRVGSAWHVPPGAGAAAGRIFAVTGIVEDPSNLLDEFALVAPGQLASPGDVRIFLGISMDSAAASAAGNVIPRSAIVSAPEPSNALVSPATVVLVVSVLGLVFIGLVATAAFTVMAQRRQRALGMLSSLGATEADVRFVLIADGLLAGLAGAAIGAAAAAGAWFWYYPHLETATAHRTDPLALPWPAIIIGLLLAVATSVIAAVWPGRAVAKVPVVSAISGRVDPPQLITRSLRPGILFLVGGLFLLFVSGGWDDGGGNSGRYAILAGLICCEIASALLAPFLVDRLARLAWRAPLASRLAVRDLERYRSRSGAAMAAVSFAVFIATIAIIIASVRFDDALDYTAPNMTSSQLIFYTPGNDLTQVSPGQFTPAAKLAAAKAQADTLAAQLHAPAPLELDVPVSVHVSMPGQPTQNQFGTIISLHGRGFGGTTWVATPALLKAFGISPGEVDPRADVLTVRAGLPSTGGLALVNGAYLGNPPNEPCPAGLCILSPVIQEVSKLPAGTSMPNTVITERAVRALHETPVPVGWLIQAPAALTPAQINGARQAALSAGATVETKNGQLSLGEISNGATLGGLLLALGVLSMTVGLIRSETARDLRTLTAAGASARTRRALTGVTAGVLGLLGAGLGAVAAILAGVVWAHSSLIQTFGNVPWQDIGLLVIGMPLIAAIAGWLLGGRAPSAVSGQPLE